MDTVNTLVILILFLIWPTFFILALAFFRIQVKQYLNPIIVSSLIMTPASAMLQYAKLNYLLTIVQPLLFLFCLMVLFHFKFFNSIIMTGLTFIYDIFVEYSYNIVIVQFDYDQFVQVTQNEFIIQGFWVAFVNLLTAYLIKKYRWGFTFIAPRIHKHRPSNMSIQKKLYMSAVIFIAFLSTISLCLYIWKDMFLIVLSATSIILAFVLHYSYKREFIE
ncbi:hypothetical protein SAMN03159341_104247 [Paenibacillus sp. 1_12]|uniref:hypothetical protein n=1 Tax=Paenibacillus sp. 1_12 TaxID=1566278 RepID=UPI0008EDCD81|nr:hypothetical protein [Paenibacillus sp. 1_12]SFL24953.1 hypothetical protein SAMN03159341_104247 [Paenibacillus sp. 1_12]